MSAHIFMMTVATVLTFVLTSQTVQAQSLFGSGAMQGGMVCPYETRTSRAAVSVSDDEREERQRIQRLEAQLERNEAIKERAEENRTRLRTKVERYFDAEVVDFLLDVHIEGLKQCDQYKSAANRCLNPAVGAAAVPASGDAAVAAAPAPVDCDSKTDVPPILAGKWTEQQGTRGNYCRGNTYSNAGSVLSSICSDETLRLRSEREETGRSARSRVRSSRSGMSASECARALADYRKNTIEQGDAADDIADNEEEIEEREFNIADARQRIEIDRRYRMRNETESDCEECDAYNRGYSQQRPRRDWGSTISNVVGGLGLMYVGRRAESAANEQAAQLGYPADSSYGYPFYRAGIAGVINGLAGPGAYGCASTNDGGGFQYGANGMLSANGNMNGANSPFGPFGAQGGAFGYPPNMHGTPWGGGAFNPGINMNGGFNGPFGGVGGQAGFPNNGNMALCFTFPCNVGGQGGIGGGFGGQLGGGFGGQLGGGLPGQFPGQFPGAGGQFGLNGQLSAQYQLQMLQQQQQMAQQYYQQQQQYQQQQYQQQMAYYQMQQQRQQQSYQIQQQIAQLNLQLQQLQYSNGGGNFGGQLGGGLSGGFNLGIGGGGSFNLGGGGSFGGSIGAPLPGGYNPGGVPGGGGYYPPQGGGGPIVSPGWPSPGGVPTQPVNGGRGR